MSIITNQKQMFETSVKTQLARQLRLTQSQSQLFCRENIDVIHQMFEDGFSSVDAAKQVVATVDDVEELKDRLPLVFSGW